MPAVVIDVERTRHLHCGLGQVCFHLGRAIVAAGDPDIEPVLLMRPAQRELFPVPPARWMAASVLRRETVTRLARPVMHAVGARPRYDLWHATHQDSKFLPASRRVPLVLTIHDLNFLREKPPAVIRRRLKRLQSRVDRAAAITTASHFAAAEIDEHLDLGAKEIAVIPHGVCVDAADARAQRPAFLPSGRFLFSIGDITAKKNFLVLVDLAARLQEYRIVIAGKDTAAYAVRLRQEIDRAGLGGRVLMPGIVSDAERAWLFANCEAFLFPSLSEGFGLPVLEAMSCGRPVFASAATSLQEIGGRLAFYWTEMEAGEMTRVVRAGLESAAADAGLEGRLREYAGTFTWPVAARRYLALYRRVLGLRGPAPS